MFPDSSTVSQASGQPGVPTVLFNKTWAGGAIPEGQGFMAYVRLRAPFSESAQFETKLGAVVLDSRTLEAGSHAILHIIGWREEGPRKGYAGGWRVNGDADHESTSFSWTGPMVLKVTGTSAELGGAILQNLFVER